MKKFATLDERQLAEVNGGVIPLAVWAIWGGVAAGFGGGISVGLNRVNRKKK